ncbi:MAG: NUDIX domain-containing protein [Azospirillaceae bacterium]
MSHTPETDIGDPDRDGRVEPDGPDAIRVIERSTCFQGFFRMDKFRLVHRRHDGGWIEPIDREVLMRGEAVAVLPYDPTTDRVVLLEQFRAGAYAADRPAWLTEIVAGIVDPGETVEAVARREAVEEAGLDLLDLEKVAEFFSSPGGSSEIIHLYVARVAAPEGEALHGLDEEGEDIRVFTLPGAEAAALATEGRCDNATTLIALLWFALNRDALRRRWSSP